MDLFTQDFKEGFYKHLLDNSSLQENIQKLCDYLSEHIPCDAIVLYEMDRELLEARIVFQYRQNLYSFKPKIKSIADVWPIEDIISYFEDFEEIRYWKDLRSSKFYKRYFSINPSFNSSLEYCFCANSTYQKFQIFILVAKKINTFTDEHIKMIRQVQPCIHYLSVQLLEVYNEHQLNLSSLHELVADSEKLLQRCPGLAEMNSQLQDIAKTNSTVLIYGETGVGKELVADTICSLSSRANNVFQKLNCGSLTPSLIDSELFGVVKGAYTGAVETKKGIFESAHGGTLYLDEVGELSLDAQVRLLRVLEAKEIRRVGDTKRIPIDVRIVAATNRDLDAMVLEGTFRSDLLYRLQVIPLYMPSLSERPEDIPILAHYFYNSLIQQLDMATPPKFTKETLQQLLDHPWPGNVRQLRYAIERSLILGKNKKELDIIDPIRAPSNSNIKQNKNVYKVSNSQTENINTPEYYEILSALRRSHGRIEGPLGAANTLGITPSTLRYKMKKYKIKRQEMI